MKAKVKDPDKRLAPPSPKAVVSRLRCLKASSQSARSLAWHVTLRLARVQKIRNLYFDALHVTVIKKMNYRCVGNVLVYCAYSSMALALAGGC